MSAGHIVMLLDNDFRSDTRVEKEIGMLVQAEFQVSIVCLKADGLPETEQKWGAQVFRWFNDNIKRPLRLGYLSHKQNAARRVSELNPDAVHCHDAFMLPVGVCVKQLVPPCRLVYDAHEYVSGWPYYRELPTWWTRLKGSLVWKEVVRKEKKALRNVDLLITSSTPILHRMRPDLRTGAEAMAVQNAPLHSQSIDRLEFDVREMLGIPQSAIILVQSGNIYQEWEVLRKQILDVQSVANVHVLFIGNNAKFYATKKAVETTGMGERVHFLDYRFDELHHVLAACDIGLLYVNSDVYESHLLGSPNRLLDYTHCGLPILAVEHAQSRTLNSIYGHIVFWNAHREGDLQRALHEVIENRLELKRKAAIAALNTSWESEFKPVVDSYLRMLQR